VLKDAGVPGRYFAAKETTHNKINVDLGQQGDPATKVCLEFLRRCTEEVMVDLLRRPASLANQPEQSIRRPFRGVQGRDRQALGDYRWGAGAPRVGQPPCPCLHADPWSKLAAPTPSCWPLSRTGPTPGMLGGRSRAGRE